MGCTDAAEMRMHGGAGNMAQQPNHPRRAAWKPLGAALLISLATAGGCAEPLGIFGPKRAVAPKQDASASTDTAKSQASEPAGDADVAQKVDEYLAAVRRMHEPKPDSATMPGAPTQGAAAPESNVARASVDAGSSDAARSTAGPPSAASNAALATVDAAAPASAKRDANRVDASVGRSNPAPPVVLSVSVGAAHDADPTPTRDDAATGVSNQALDVRAEQRRKTVEEYLTDLERQASQPGGEQAAWQCLMIRAALDDRPPTAQMLERLPGAQRAALSNLFDLACAVRGVLRDPTSSADGAVDCAQRLERTLSELADLRVARVELCTRVMTFGVFEPMSAEQFVAGKANQTILYCEVENFASEVDGEGSYRSRFSSRVEVLTPTGQSMFSQEEPNIEDRCRRRRTDFFIAQRITLPATLPPGDYLLKVTLEDKLANRVNESSVPLTLRSASSLAKSD